MFLRVGVMFYKMFLLFVCVLAYVEEKFFDLIEEAQKILNQKNYQERIDSAFRDAVSAGNERAVLRLLKKGANVNWVDSSGHSCIHEAVLGGHYKLIKYLVDYGADVDLKSGLIFGNSPIEFCFFSINNEKCLEELSKCNVKLDIEDSNGNTLLHSVVRYTPENLDFIKKLLDYGVDPRTSNLYGNTCLHIAATNTLCTEEEAISLAKLFVKRGVDIDFKNFVNWETALQMACRTGKIGLVDFLLREGAAMEVKNRRGLTAFEHLYPSNTIMMDIMIIFIKHFALRKHRGESVDDCIAQRIASDEELESIYCKYEKDLNNLKSIQIMASHRVTLHHILCGEQKEVVKYLSSPYIQNNIFSQNVSTLYWREIRHRYSNVMAIVKFQEESFRVVDEIFHGKLPYLCAKHLSQYLSKKDVEELSVLLRE